MDDINELAIVLTARLDELQAGLDKAQGMLQGFANKQNSTANDVTKGIISADLLEEGARRLGDFIEEAALAAAQTEALSAALTAVGANMGVSKESLDANVKSIESLGFTEADATMEMLKFTKAHMDGKMAVQLAQVAMDYADASGRGYKETLDLLSNSVEMGNARALRQLGITTSVHQIYTLYAATLGKTAQNLSNAEQRQATFNAIMQQATNVAGVHAAVMNTAGGSVKLLAMEAEQAKDNIGQFFTPTLKLLADAARVVLEAFNRLAQSPFWDVLKKANAALMSLFTGGLPLASLSKSVNDLVGNMSGAGTKGLGAPAFTSNLQQQSLTFDQMVAKAKAFDLTNKTFANDTLPDILKKEEERFKAEGMGAQDQIKALKSLDQKYKLSYDQRAQLAQVVADKELQAEIATQQKIQSLRSSMESEFASTMAQTFTGAVNLFGNSTINMQQLWENMVNKMVEKLIESGIMDFIGILTGGSGGVLGGLFGFDDPSNDRQAFNVGGKWFMDALSNFSKGYVNAAVASPMTGQVFGAAAAAGTGIQPAGGSNVNVNLSFPMLMPATSAQKRELGQYMATVIKRSGATVS